MEKKKAREAKRKELKIGLSNFVIQMRNSILWQAIKQRLEGKF
jgi:hypothetical protein